MMNRKRKRRQLRSCDLFFFRRHPSAISPGPVSRLKYGDGMFQVVLQCNCYILARTKQWKSIASQEISESESRILVHRSALDDLSILVFKDFHPIPLLMVLHSSKRQEMQTIYSQICVWHLMLNFHIKADYN